ncbi:MAG: hypothetical protein WAN70_03715 [Terriglobales bacterium]|jgi:hypothetical protein
MKSLCLAASLWLLTAPAFGQAGSPAAFAQLKTLEGNWSGKTTDGRPVQTTYRVTSGGSALMGEILGKEDMISMFHMDGDRLLMTHYCGTGNQPRMVATVSPDSKTVTFNYLDATNLLSSQPGHMERMVVTMIDANHYTEQWDFAAKDGSKMHEQFDLQRAK